MIFTGNFISLSLALPPSIIVQHPLQSRYRYGKSIQFTCRRAMKNLKFQFKFCSRFIEDLKRAFPFSLCEKFFFRFQDKKKFSQLLTPARHELKGPLGWKFCSKQETSSLFVLCLFGFETFLQELTIFRFDSLRLCCYCAWKDGT